MSTPRNADDVKILHAHFNMTLIVTLTQETPLPETWFEGTAVRNVFMPIENYKAPTTAQVDHFLGLHFMYGTKFSFTLNLLLIAVQCMLVADRKVLAAAGHISTGRSNRARGSSCSSDSISGSCSSCDSSMQNIDATYCCSEGSGVALSAMGDYSCITGQLVCDMTEQAVRKVLTAEVVSKTSIAVAIPPGTFSTCTDVAPGNVTFSTASLSPSPLVAGQNVTLDVQGTSTIPILAGAFFNLTTETAETFEYTFSDVIPTDAPAATYHLRVDAVNGDGSELGCFEGAVTVASS
ncbi:hypothetical protein HKX48_005924 [Thoreauomyces humboldtii]|nr:hypothetical protein HKX48_005924 [Thoreauomyces humboldtii]